jgi:hypothetical protein
VQANECKSRYDVQITMRSAHAIATLVLLVTPAAADTFGGFSGIDKPYLVNQDRLCIPLSVKAGAATGTPRCEPVAADVKAKLSFKSPIVQSGIKASFAATASGRTLTVTKKSGEPVVTWQAPDAIGKIVEVYASQYEDRVAVAYTTRRLGKEVTDIVAFTLVETMGSTQPVKPADTTPATTPPTTATTPTPTDPKLDKALATARKAPKAKAPAAWQAVVAIDSGNAEAQYRLAAFDVGAKRTADAITKLESLAKSTRADAIEWLVEARFDKAFAALRADPKYRTAVGLDRASQTPYERLMGFGGQWEQTGTSCETPEVQLTATRGRTVKVVVKGSCRGDTFSVSRKGTWRLSDDGIILSLPQKGKAATAKDEAPCTFEKERDEDALHCVLDKDLDFKVLPTRR